MIAEKETPTQLEDALKKGANFNMVYEKKDIITRWI